MPYSPNSPMPMDTISLAKWICEVLFLEPSQHQSFFESVLAHHSKARANEGPHHISSYFTSPSEFLAFYLMCVLLADARDKQRQPLYLHSFRVFLACRHLSPDQRIAALLHDCVEDGQLPHNPSETKSDKWVIYDIIKSLFGADVSKLVIFLTRPANVTYSSYIRVVSSKLDVLPIKLADLRDNLDPTRGPIPDSLRQRYEEAVNVLESTQERYESLNAASKAVNSFGTSSKDLERSLEDIEETAMFKKVYEYTITDNIYEERARIAPPDQVPEPMCRCATVSIDSSLISEQEAALDSYSLSSLAELEPPPNSADLDFDPTYSAECDMVWIGDDFKEVG